jgi:glycosyltransferase involved in cell wall biosynthesis
MKILCVHQGAELYGSDRSFALSVKTLRNKFPTAELTVVLPKKGELVSYLEPYIDHLRIASVGTVQRSDLRKPFSTAKSLLISTYNAWKDIQNYDVIYINTIVVFAYMIAAIFTQKLTLNHVREIPGKKEGLIFSLLFRLNRSHLIFNSKYTKNSYSFMSAKRSHVVLNGVDVQSEELIPLPKKTFNILLIGRVHENKGQLLAIETIKLLAQEYPFIRLRIVGSAVDGQDWQLENVLDAIKSNQLEDIVEHIPFQADPQKQFLWSTISLVPSILPESFGRVAVESMAFGRPVIASELGGLTEIIQNDKGGYLFNVGNKKDLALKISLLLNDTDLLHEKSTEAFECFKSQFSESVYIDKFSKTFEQILQQR